METTNDVDLVDLNARLTFSLLIAAGMAYGESLVHQHEDPTRTALTNIYKFCLKSANRKIAEDFERYNRGL